jgi:mRNA interferase RelE/StbE
LPYALLFQPRARVSLGKAPPEMQVRLKAAIVALADVPRPPGARKLRGQRETWRIRVGDWRVIYVPDDRSRAVVVTVLGHRRDVHDR